VWDFRTKQRAAWNATGVIFSLLFPSRFQLDALLAAAGEDRMGKMKSRTNAGDQVVL
jgi:hypothetical protein